jgi:hypothetical protein
MTHDLYKRICLHIAVARFQQAQHAILPMSYFAPCIMLLGFLGFRCGGLSRTLVPSKSGQQRPANPDNNTYGKKLHAGKTDAAHIHIFAGRLLFAGLLFEAAAAAAAAAAD